MISLVLPVEGNRLETRLVLGAHALTNFLVLVDSKRVGARVVQPSIDEIWLCENAEKKCYFPSGAKLPETFRQVSLEQKAIFCMKFYMYHSLFHHV